MNGALELFWKVLAAACLLWYALLTGYVTVRGVIDIRRMLRRLSDRA